MVIFTQNCFKIKCVGLFLITVLTYIVKKCINFFHYYLTLMYILHQR